MPDAHSLVSIIVPTYNRESLLRDAIASVLAQTYQEWELIVLDDGSTDGTPAYLAGITDPRVRVHRGPHRGEPGELRNTGIALSRGPYIAFLDSDDVWMPSKLDRQITDLRVRGRRWGYTHHRWIDGDGRPLPAPAGRQWKECDGWILREILAVEAWIAMPTVVIERTLFDEVGGFDESFPVVEDYEAWTRVARAAEAALIPEPLAAVRVHASSLSRRQAIQMHEQLARLYLTVAADHELQAYHPLCRDRLAEVRFALAHHYRNAGRTAEALRTLGSVLAHRPWSSGTWTAIAKALAYPVVPSSMLAAYRRTRMPAGPGGAIGA